MYFFTFQELGKSFELPSSPLVSMSDTSGAIVAPPVVSPVTTVSPVTSFVQTSTTQPAAEKKPRVRKPLHKC